MEWASADFLSHTIGKPVVRPCDPECTADGVVKGGVVCSGEDVYTEVALVEVSSSTKTKALAGKSGQELVEATKELISDSLSSKKAQLGRHAKWLDKELPKGVPRRIYFVYYVFLPPGFKDLSTLQSAISPRTESYKGITFEVIPILRPLDSSHVADFLVGTFKGRGSFSAPVEPIPAQAQGLKQGTALTKYSENPPKPLSRHFSSSVKNKPSLPALPNVTDSKSIDDLD
jgi:hypothetical protein